MRKSISPIYFTGKSQLKWFRWAGSEATAPAAQEHASQVSGARMWCWQVHGYGPLSELRLERARVPRLSSPGQLLVRVDAVSINPLDVAMIGGYGARILNTMRSCKAAGDASLEFPLVVGRDFCGVVESSAPGVRPEVGRGSRVWGVLPPHHAGALAQYVVAEQRWVEVAPTRLAAPHAAGLLYAGLSAAAALRAACLPVGTRGGARGTRVLLMGLGGAGTLALQLLRHAAAQVVVVCPEEQTELARELGAVEVLAREVEGLGPQLEEKGPYAAVLDFAGLGGEHAARLTCRYERYVTLTSPLLRHTDAYGLLPGLAATAAEWVQQTASAEGDLSRVRWAYFYPCADTMRLLKHLVDTGEVVACTEQVYEWEKAHEALERAARGHLRGKVVVSVRGEHL